MSEMFLSHLIHYDLITIEWRFDVLRSCLGVLWVLFGDCLVIVWNLVSLIPFYFYQF